MTASDLSGAAPGAPAAYHVELRQFPHNFCHFNLTERELYDTIVGPWAREQWIELGERKWSPHQAKLTVLQGTHLALEQLSMGRGWRNAQRTGRDVTDHVLAAARASAEADGAQGRRVDAPAGVSEGAALPADLPPSQMPDEGLLADSLGLELLTQLASDTMSLQRAWELAASRHPKSTAGQSLLLVERAITALLESGLIVLIRHHGVGDGQQPITQAEAQAVIGDIDSWTREIVRIARR